jgi:two-component system, OmpR family, response regulator MtrA
VGGTGTVSVLLVEDDRATADLYSLKLRLDGYRVHHASDGTTADVIFRAAHPHVVCVDHRLPDVRGTHCAERFAAQGAIVFLLTNDQESFERPPRGVARSLLKSRTNPGQLSAAIREVVKAGGASSSAG